jgi:hypothetical protein
MTVERHISQFISITIVAIESVDGKPGCANAITASTLYFRHLRNQTPHV